MKQTPTSTHPVDLLEDPARIDAQTWKPLRLLSFYRAILAGLLLVLFFAIGDISVLGRQDPALYTITCTLYLAFSLVAGFTARLRRPGYVLQTTIQILVDIFAITLLIHTSGGQSSGMGILLVIAVATGSVLLPGRLAFFFASVAALLVMAEQFLATLVEPASRVTGYTQTGLLGLALFATAGLTYLLTRRIRESEALARRHAVSVANLAKLNEHIVQRLQAGIIVADHEHRIRLINETARKLLKAPHAAEGQPLNLVSGPLFQKLSEWYKVPDQRPALLETGPASPGLLAQFTLLGTAEGIGSLIFLEDMAAMEKQALQNKLASLGRLTASIAHEIRNPLGAISHASQLLNESQDLSPEDRRLNTIIKDHTIRVNTIVKNVLQLSRSDTNTPQRIDLGEWLEKFVNDFIQSGNCEARQIGFDATRDEVVVYMDPSLLHQVIWNLCQNAIQHSSEEPRDAKIRLVAENSPASSSVTLDIIDNGGALDAEVSDTIFEPFFTTKSSGTGLGLYIAREICESSHAQLDYIVLPDESSCFRITFPDKTGIPATAFA